METNRFARLTQSLLIALLLISLVGFMSPALGNMIFVHAGAAGADNGTNWADAFTNLQDAMAASNFGDEIWVTAGTYKPDQGTGITPGDRSAHFLLKSDVAMYGGFSGTETELFQRDWGINKTVLSGDLNGDDGPNFAGYAENSRTIIKCMNTGSSATVLDGFVITHAQGESSASGALVISNSSPTVANCVISENAVSGWIGAGAGITGGNPAFVNCVFRDNVADAWGGAIYSNGASPTFSNCAFMNNSANSGGAIIFYGTANNPTFTNSIFVNNSADTGGALNVSSGTLTVINTIFWGNTAPTGPQIYLSGGSLDISYSDVQGGLAGISDPYGTGAILYANNIDSDPLLTVDGHLQAGSPCLDSGSPATALTQDFDNEQRPHGGGYDIGLDEFVDMDGDGLPDYWELTWFKGLNQNGAGDPDGDGSTNLEEYVNGTQPVDMSQDTDGDGFTIANGDCNDDDPAIHPGAPEVVDGVDNNCNGLIDEQGAPPVAADDAFTVSEDSIDNVLDLLANDSDPDAGDTLTIVTVTPASGGSTVINTGTLLTYTPARHFNGTETFAYTIRDSSGFTDTAQVEITVSPVAEIFYVRSAATGTGDGTNWADAFTSLQDALTVAGAGDQIWAAAGAYRPDQGVGIRPGDRFAYFRLRSGVALYGGFSGVESSLSERDWRRNPTVLSGDLQDNDGPGFLNYDDNSLHILLNRNVDATTRLDGFTITGGSATGNDVSSRGGGIYNDNAHLTIANCSFIKNRAFYQNTQVNKGGAIYNELSSPALLNCTFRNNSAYDGGAIYNLASKPTLTNCSFVKNSTQYQVYNEDDNSDISTHGGAIYNEGSNPTITHSTFFGNRSYQGGAIYNLSSSVTVTHSLFWGNRADLGSQISQLDASLAVSFSDLQGGDTAILNEGTSTLTLYTDIMDADCLLSPDGHLQTGSPCIDAGDPAVSITDDMDGETRPNGPSNDIGADEFHDVDGDTLPDSWETLWYGDLTHNGTDDPDMDGLTDHGEFQAGTNPFQPDTDGDGYSDFEEVQKGTDPSDPGTYPCLVYVDLHAAGLNDGTTWADAFTSLQDGLGVTVPGCQVWVASGVYKPDQGTGFQPGNQWTSWFTLRQGVAIYGGFAGHETELSQRDLRKNETLLSGDLMGDDAPGFVNYADNALHVVRAKGKHIDRTSVLDGFTITAGNAAGTYYSEDRYGGGMFLDQASPTIRNCIFRKNTATRSGGGVYAKAGLTTLQTNPTFTNCIFSENYAQSSGGAAGTEYGSATFMNCSLANNSSVTGGAILNIRSNLRITNSILWNNAAADGSQIIQNGNALTITHSDVQGGQASIIVPAQSSIALYANNVDADPLLTPDGHLQAGSPCIDAADPAASVLTDIDGEARPQGAGPDMGADEFLDSDGDMLPDFWEFLWFGNLGPDGAGDFDGDGLTNLEELQNNTDPTRADTDGDGYTDPEELQKGTDPRDPGSYPGRIYVDLRATGSNNGSSWLDAYNSLQDALSAARPGFEIWVAAGTYKPDQGVGMTLGDSAATFHLRPAVSLLGGFAGNEVDLSERDWRSNKTVLTGDLNGDDRPDFINYDENSLHVVTFHSTTSDATAVLDGFTVTHGNARKITAGDSYGGGLTMTYASPQIRNSIFSDNRAEENGGAIRSTFGNPLITNCVFKNNVARYGGAIYTNGGQATLSNCVVTRNFATFGGGICVNRENTAITHSLIWNNHAGLGGALYVMEADPTITNSILWANRAPAGPQIYVNERYFSYPTIRFSDLQGGRTAIYSVGGTITYQNNIDADPLLTADGHLQSGSPCIDAADPASALAEDMDAETRPGGAGFDMGPDEFYDLDGDGLADFWESRFFGDLSRDGAGDFEPDGLTNQEEFQLGTRPVSSDSDGDGFTDSEEQRKGTDPNDQKSYSGRIYVNANSTGGDNGTSWTDAFTKFQDALITALPGFEVWVASGVYTPDQGAGRTAGDLATTFGLRGGVKLYGGFSGGETDLSQRDWETHQTVLSGNLAAGGNSYHVVSGSHLTDSALLDGFTVTGGRAEGDTANPGGGGLLLLVAHPLIRNCTFESNSAAYGGAMGNKYSMPAVEASAFTNNSSTGDGGAIDNDFTRLTVADSMFNGNSAMSRGGAINTMIIGDLSVTGCSFTANHAQEGGALYVQMEGSQTAGPFFFKQGTISVTESIFENNTAGGRGGGISIDGTTLVLTNSIMNGNSANNGGGIYNFFSDLYAENSTLVNNAAALSGGALFMTSEWSYYMMADATFRNSILWGNTAPTGAQIYRFDSDLAVQFCDLQGGKAGVYDAPGGHFTHLFTYANNLETDPLLSSDGHLPAGSPCIDTADPATTLTVDIDGDPRPLGAGFDMGADEFSVGDQDGDGYAVGDGDCNDLDASIYPGAAEICDGLDNNCDGTVDEGFDGDGDGYTPCEGDCDDGNFAIHPGAPEICGNSMDENCDGYAEWCTVHDVAVTSFRVPKKVRACSTRPKKVHAEVMNQGQFPEEITVQLTVTGTPVPLTSEVLSLDPGSVARLSWDLDPSFLAAGTASVCVDASIGDSDALLGDNTACREIIVVGCQ